MRLRFGYLVVRRVCLAAAVLVVGCSDAVGPEVVEGTYALSAPMPVTVSGSFATRLAADTLVVNPDGTATRRLWIEHWLLAGGDTTRQMSQAAYTYRLQAEAIGFLSQCPVGANCIAPRREWHDVLAGAAAIRPRTSPEALFVRIGSAAP